jgi:hypothetical protein
MNEVWEHLPPLQLLGWSAWAPGRPDRASWETWARAPKTGGRFAPVSDDVTSDTQTHCKDFPPLLRRRCSGLTRMVVKASIAACRAAGVDPSALPTVFCSRHGEIRVLRELLEALYKREPFSPTLFSNSVHHTPTGYFDLVCGNRLPSKTLSARDANLVCGFMESLGALRTLERGGSAAAPACLLVVADETLPEPFQNETIPPRVPYALALVLALPCSDAKSPTLVLSRSARPEEAPVAGQDEVLDFLRWLVKNEGPFEMTTPFGNWQWTNTTCLPS